MAHKLPDLVDIGHFQSLLESLNQVHPFPFAIIDTEGHRLAATAWPDFCSRFQAPFPEGEGDCLPSGQYVQRHLPEANPAVSCRCPHGLLCCAIPFIIGGIHYGSFITGPILLEKPDGGLFRAQAQQYGFDPAAYLKAVEKVPVWNRSQWNHHRLFIKGLVEVLAEGGSHKLREAEATKRIQDWEDKFHDLFNHAPVGIFHSTPEGRLLAANPVLAAMLGHDSPEALIAATNDLAAQIYEDPEIRPRIVEELLKTDGWVHYREVIWRRKDQRLITVDMTGRKVPGAGGGIACLEGFIQDITERKRAEAELRQTRSILQAAMDQSTAGIAIADAPSGELRYVNDAGLLIRGGGRESVVNGVGINQYVASWQLLDLDGRPLKPEEVPLARAILFGETCSREFIIRRSSNDDRLVLAKAAPIRDAQGQVVEGIVVFMDITERKQAEEALHRAKEFARTVLENLADGVVACDAGGKLVLFNRTSREWHGMDALALPPEAWGRHYDLYEPDGLTPLPTASIPLVRAFQGECLREVGMVISARGQPVRHLLASGGPFFDAQQKKLGAVVVMRDITERKLAGEALAQLNARLKGKNRELEQIVYIASHDLRSPLVNIDGYSREMQFSLEELVQAAQGGLAPQPDLQAALRGPVAEMTSALRYIRTSAAHMDALLKGLLKISRLGRAALAIIPLDMNELVAKVTGTVEFQVRKSNIGLGIGELPPCQGDATQVSQVFANLLGNAIKFLDPQRPGRVRITGRSDGPRSVYCVEDNGVGIAPAHQQIIFEAFHRLDPSRSEGEGLGLTIVRQVLSRLAGEVWMESAPGEGSRFFVALPAAQPPAD